MKSFNREVTVRACVAFACVLSGACARSGNASVRAGMATMAVESDAERLARAGAAYAEVGDSIRAAQYLSLAIDNGGDERRLFPQLLEICVRDRQYRAALFYAESYLRRHPHEFRLTLVTGTLYAGMGEPKLARQRFEDVLRVQPKMSEAHYALAVLWRDTESDPVQADRYFREYLTLDPGGAHAEEARGSLLSVVP